MNGFIKRHFTMPRGEIGYLRFILESYDGLAFVSTLDSREALVEIAYHPSRRNDAEALLAALTRECSMAPAPIPESGSYPDI